MKRLILATILASSFTAPAMAADYSVSVETDFTALKGIRVDAFKMVGDFGLYGSVGTVSDTLHYWEKGYNKKLGSYKLDTDTELDGLYGTLGINYEITDYLYVFGGYSEYNVDAKTSFCFNSTYNSMKGSKSFNINASGYQVGLMGKYEEVVISASYNKINDLPLSMDAETVIFSIGYAF